MSDVVNLVQNNTLPVLYVEITDGVTGKAIDISTATLVTMAFRALGASVLTDTLTGTLVAGFVNPDGSITNTGYAVAGSGGRVSFTWNPTTLANIGPYEASVSITFPSGATQTVYDPLRFFVRASF